MTFWEITQVLLPFLLEGGIVGTVVFFLTAKSIKEKAVLENKSIALENENSNVATLKEVIEVVRMDAQQRKEESEQFRCMYEQKCQENADLKEENTAIKMMMCVNMGCALRRPMMGQGDAWYHEHCMEENIGCNYTPVNQLLRQCNLNKKGTEIKSNDE